MILQLKYFFIDDQDITLLSLSSETTNGLRSPGCILFSDTIANNIAFGIAESIGQTDRDKLIKQATEGQPYIRTLHHSLKDMKHLSGKRHYVVRRTEATCINCKGHHQASQNFLFDDCLSGRYTYGKNRF